MVATGTGKDKADSCVEKCVDECFNHLMGDLKDTEPGIIATCANGCIQEKCMGKSVGKSDA